MRTAAILVKRDVVRLSVHSIAIAAKFKQISFDILASNYAAAQGVSQITGLVDGKPAAVDEEAGTADRLVVAFAHVGRKAADQIEVSAIFQPGALDERCRR